MGEVVSKLFEPQPVDAYTRAARRLKGGDKARYFFAWEAWHKERLAKLAKMRRCVMWMTKRPLKSGFGQWHGELMAKRTALARLRHAALSIIHARERKVFLTWVAHSDALRQNGVGTDILRAMARRDNANMGMLLQEHLKLQSSDAAALDRHWLQTERGDTFLSWAIRHNNAMAARTLIGAGASVDGRTARGATPLLISSQLGHTSCLEALLKARASVDGECNGDTPLLVACQEGNADCASLLLRAGAAVNQAKSSNGATPLINACSRDHLDIVWLLVGAGASVNQAAHGGFTALIAASMEGLTPIVDALLRNGAHVDQARTNGATAIMVAAKRGHVECAEVLASFGAHTNPEMLQYMYNKASHKEKSSPPGGAAGKGGKATVRGAIRTARNTVKSMMTPRSTRR